MPTKILHCQNSIPCLGIDGEDGDWPIRNLGAEAPDVPLYYCTLYAKKGIVLGGNCSNFTAMSLATSTVSQAQACAVAKVVIDGISECSTITQDCKVLNNCIDHSCDTVICPYGQTCKNGECHPPQKPCTPTSCGDLQQCVQGECQPFQPINDFGFVPFDSNLKVAIGPLDPNKCCADTLYSATLTAVGFEPFLWTLSGGALPPGLTLSSDGIIAGTPTVPGSYDFQVQVQDSSGGQGTKNFTIRVVDITSTSPLPDGTVLQAYSQTLQQTGGLPPISWQIADGVLPPGLSLDESTGIISGTPPALVSGQPNEGGTYPITVSIQDQAT